MNISEYGHIVNMTPANAGSTAFNSDVVSLKNYHELDIVVNFGVIVSAPVIKLYECATSTGNGTARAFGYYYEADDSGDTPAARAEGTSTGVTLSGVVDNRTVTVNIRADQLDASKPWVYLNVGASTAAQYKAITGILTDCRYGKGQTPTAIA